VTRKEIRANGRKRSKVRGKARSNEENRSRRWERGAKLKLGKGRGANGKQETGERKLSQGKERGERGRKRHERRAREWQEVRWGSTRSHGREKVIY
jgi:hypothetical protein